MPDLEDGESFEMKGSAAKPYVLKNTGGVYSCTCPAWRNQSIGIEQRTCKHLRKLRGDAAETTRVGTAPPAPAARASGENGEDGEGPAGKAPPLLLALVAPRWENEADLTGFWMSEKLDGVRAYWDGARFVSRLGNPYYAPDWFVEGLPDVPLDGELWGGRKKFQRTVSIARRQDKSDHWKELLFLVFDAPAVDLPFEERMAFVKDRIQSSNATYARYHDHVVCTGTAHLRQELSRVEALGGEGLMLRKPGSRYEVGRSSTLLKVKSFKDDEARVVRYLAGEGRHKGRLGALVVEMQNGTQFSVGTGFSDAERASPPALGSVITFRYQELSDGGVPRFPTYVGVRDDVAFVPFTPEAPAPAAPVAAALAITGSGARRRFEFTSGGAGKFWEVEVQGAEHTVRYGRIGTSGQAKTKAFADAKAAIADADKLVLEKTSKGYVEVPE